METILQHAQGLVYSLLSLMPSAYHKASFNALLGLFLENQGHALPEHTQVKSASSLSRFLNRYTWSTRRVIQTTRQAVKQQLANHAPHAPHSGTDIDWLDDTGEKRQVLAFEYSDEWP